jgi:rubredoxin
MAECKHESALRMAAEALLRDGMIRTYDAVYRWTCPLCGAPQRTTRLADTVYALRHAYGWDIATHAESDLLAVYTLKKAGDMPGDPNTGTHPRRLVRDVAHDFAASNDLPITAALTKPSIHDYDGQRIPVEAIPSPKRWRCQSCGHVITKPLGQPALGGYRMAPCPMCGKSKRSKEGRIFVPVKEGEQ